MTGASDKAYLTESNAACVHYSMRKWFLYASAHAKVPRTCSTWVWTVHKNLSFRQIGAASSGKWGVDTPESQPICQAIL